VSDTETSLRRLADRVGILPEYVDQTGNEVRATSDATRIAILRAMRLDGSTDVAARAELAAMEEHELASPLEPVRVRIRGSSDAGRVRLRLPPSLRSKVAWTVTLTSEAGEIRRIEGTSVANARGEIVVRLETRLPEGYHTLEATLCMGATERGGTQSLIVVPRACRKVSRVFGIFANLYTLRSVADWGIGDLSTLGELLEWTAREGGDFVGVNPLHALRNHGWEVSPYSPVTRLYRNPIYLDPGQTPDELRGERESLRASRSVEYERVMALKRRALEPLHAWFTADEAYRRYLESEGESLERYATFEALVDHFGHGDWRRWPDAFRDPRSAEVAAFRAERTREVDFHRWLQFELDRQLGAAAERGRRAGLRIGLYQDLAIGTSACGADIWANPHLFLEGVSIGAPPDDYSATGQNWGLPPVDPRALREHRYEFYIRLLRASFRHAGALRIDHVLGLFRQFWIPEGAGGTEGAYVRFPSDDLLGILVLEARRHGAVVVGEDLGTVPPEVRPALRRRGVLASRLFYFERENGRFRPASEYEPASLATINTHDNPPLAGFWSGRDIELRWESGELESGETLEQARQEREKTKRAILERLAADGVLPSADEPARGAELRAAVHEFLCRTPAAMVGFNLDDLVGETTPVNLPGITPDRYPSWTRKLEIPVERLGNDSEVRAALRCRHRARAPLSGGLRRYSNLPSEPCV
jgi:4-alpha-glucanotransferase